MTTLFSDNFESGNFRNWSYVQAQDTRQGGPGSTTNYVAPASSFGISAHGGEDVAQFYRPLSATNLPHAKVFKEWSNVGKRDQFGRTEEKLPDGGNPDGVYKAWYFLPADYQVTSSKWTNLFQFKEEGYQNGVWHQDPSWWLNMSSARSWGAGGTEPVLFVNHWVKNGEYNPALVKAPLGRWFEVKAELHEDDRIDWYIDGKKFDTSLDSTYPVGRFYDKSDGWIFGVGHYDGVGKVWVDDVSVTTLGDTSSPTPPPTPAPSDGTWSVTPAPTKTITGTNSSETFRGGDANEKFVGNGGEDTMIGGRGGDTYTINSPGDKVVEYDGQGIDTAIISGSAWKWTLPANVENAIVTRTNGAVVIGNSLDNVIIGTTGIDTFTGGMGKDKMTSGGGYDTFVFRKGEAAGDVITDFRGNGTEAGDVLRFEGFGSDAKLIHAGEDWTVQYSGGADTFNLVGVSSLVADDVVFA